LTGEFSPFSVSEDALGLDSLWDDGSFSSRMKIGRARDSLDAAVDQIGADVVSFLDLSILPQQRHAVAVCLDNVEIAREAFWVSGLDCFGTLSR